jgi:hypothetical protein
METDEILDGKRIDPKIKKMDNLITDTAKILDNNKYLPLVDIELVLRQFARDFGSLLLFGVIDERAKE